MVNKYLSSLCIMFFICFTLLNGFLLLNCEGRNWYEYFSGADNAAYQFFLSLQMLLELLSCFYLIFETPEGRYEAVFDLLIRERDFRVFSIRKVSVF